MITSEYVRNRFPKPVSPDREIDACLLYLAFYI